MTPLIASRSGGEVAGVRHAVLGEAHQPFRAEPRDVHRGPERDPRLVGADVRGRTFAPDVLFARLERQRVGASPGLVLARADESAGNLPEKVLSAGEQPEPHPAAGAEAERRVADDHVRPDGRGLGEKGERDRVRPETEQRVVVGGEVANSREMFFDSAPHGGVLGVDHRTVLVEAVRERVDVDGAVVHRVGLDVPSVPAR